MVPVSRLESGQAPVVARDHTTTERRATTADHGESGGSRLRAVVDGQLFSRANGSPRGYLVGAHVPQGRIAAVVAEVDRGPRRQDEVRIVVDGEGVHVGMGRVGVCMLDQPAQSIRRDETTAEAKDDLARGEIFCRKESHSLDDGLFDNEVRMDPVGLGRSLSHLHIVPKAGGLGADGR